MQELLDRWSIKGNYTMLLDMWNESHRYYHNQNHLLELIDMINERKDQLSQKEYEKLMITALFHDIIYDPKRTDNEEQSVRFFEELCYDVKREDIQHIKQMILDTKTHETEDQLSKMFCEMDMSIVESDYEKLLEWENGISKEYESFGEMYRPARLEFLEKMMNRYPNNSENLLMLIDHIKGQESV